MLFRILYLPIIFRYETNAKDASKEFQHRDEAPFEKALHLIEHVGRHRGAKFFKPLRQQFSSPWIRGTNLDFWIICAAISIIGALFLRAVVGLLWRFVGRHGPAPGSAGIEIQKKGVSGKKETKKTK